MEERIKQLELVTTRLMRRAHKKMTTLITPYPISSAFFGENIEGAVLRYMFPCEGLITKGIIKLGKKPRKVVSIEVRLFNDSTSAMKGFVLSRKSTTIEPNLGVKAGDCLEISLIPNLEEPVEEVWISFLWRPTVADVEAKSFLIEELENDLLEE